MLRIERLEVRGFKSFSDRTTVEFTPGITAVVGPNGCGKSNIADALQWVLGEQSARALRGRRMEDVIFAGSESRGPGGMAEVTLHLKGRNGAKLPNGTDRVLLTRRLFRTGESDYLIDGKPSRLTDIRDLLDQVRAGRRTYGIIDQSHVASFVTSRPRDRRLFIEEAAGVAGFKQRRRLSETKLEATRSNLLRVDDILREVERQMRSLKRQASLARRARKLDEQLRALRTVWYRRRDRDLARRVQDLTEARDVAEREASHLERERARLAALLSSARRELDSGHEERDRSVEASHAALIEVQRLEREIETARTRAEVLEQEAGHREGESRRLEEDRRRREQELARLEEQRTGLEERLRHLDGRVREADGALEGWRREHGEAESKTTELERGWFDRLHDRAELVAQLSAARERASREAEREREASAAQERLARAGAEARRSLEKAEAGLRGLEAESEALSAELAAGRESEAECARRLEQCRTEEAAAARDLGSIAGEKGALDSLEVRLAGADPERELLERATADGVTAHGVMAEALTVEREFEAAAEAFLGELLPAVLVDSSSDVLRAAGLGVSGRVRLLPLDSPTTERGWRTIPEALRGDGRVRGRLVSQLRSAPGDGERFANVAARLEDALLVDELSTALELHRRHTDWSFVSLAGDVVATSGVVTLAHGGAPERDGMLTRTRRRDELARVLEDATTRHEAAAGVLDGARDALRRAELARRELEERQRALLRRLEGGRHDVRHAEREVERLEREAGLADGVREQAAAELGSARSRAAELQRAVEAAEAVTAEARRVLDDVRTKAREIEHQVRSASTDLGSLTSDRRALAERLEGVGRDTERLRRELGELRERTEHGDEEQRRAREEAEALRATASRAEALLATARQRRVDADAAAQERAQRLTALSERVQATEARLDRAGEEFEGARARRESATLEAERSLLALEHEREGCREELGCEASQLPGERPEGFPDEVLDTDALLKEEILQLRRRREKVGPVNPLAEEEFAELSERFESLSSQREDLSTSIDELREAIRRMNRESRERFLEAFHAIRRHYKEQFALLFRGGRADLILEDESDPLESGIEIMCQPPGKKLQSVSLLSGGEKALAATAVLFAIFKYQPPPFCLLDEVDAPLDDANVGRFADTLRKFTDSTQFILITHNKRSMEMADLLYGVTMPEPGISNLVSMTLD